uniref:Exosome complex component RRP46 n=1 Tax=Parastrongyloides trichosuri TaxID=131310 RepID=A0A0N4ZX04_PARTI
MVENVNVNSLMLKAIYPKKYYDDFLSSGVFPNGREISKFEDNEISLEKKDKENYSKTAVVVNSSSYVIGTQEISVRRNVENPPCFSVEITKTSEKKQREHEYSFAENVLTFLCGHGLLYSFDQLLSSDKVLQFVINSKIKYSGNPSEMLQMCLAALVSSLATISLPSLYLQQFAKDDIKISTNDVKFETELCKKFVLNDYPVATSLSLYETEDQNKDSIMIYSTPPSIKEFCSTGIISVVGNKNNIMYLSGGGSEPFDMDKMKKFIHDSFEYQKKFEEQLMEKINKL